MNKLLFWWYWITNRSFRNWIYYHDIESFYSDIERRRIEMIEYKSHLIYKNPQ